MDCARKTRAVIHLLEIDWQARGTRILPTISEYNAKKTAAVE